jgi:hypothetical protein
MPQAATIEHGLTEILPVDETGLLTSDASITPARVKRAYAGGDGSTQALLFVDPTLVLTVNGRLTASPSSGLLTTEIGEALVTAPSNFAIFGTSVFGHDLATGTIVYEEAGRTLSQGDQAMHRFTAVHYPFVTNS